MPCPTCDHTMARIGGDGLFSLFLCERCGTVRRIHSVTNDDEGVYVPELVERCRTFGLQLGAGTILGSQYASKPLKELWHRLGIAESIKPEDRPGGTKP